MKKYIRLTLCITLFFSALSAHDMQKNKPKHKAYKSEYKKVVKIGNRASKLLLKTLGGNLKKRLKKDGPAGALEFCATSAAKLTGEVDNKLGKNVSIKRITLKHRNPANEALGDEKEILQALEALNKNHIKLPRHLIQKKADKYIYYKPLVINKGVCLKCHGTNIKPNLAKKIKEYYPTDKAIGYKMGDLRGAIVVTIKR